MSLPKNVKEAVVVALKRNPQGLKIGSSWQRRRDQDFKDLFTEASRARWPNSDRIYSTLGGAIRELILEGNIYVKMKRWDVTYFYDPERGSEQFGPFMELNRRIESCQDKLSGHGFGSLNVISRDPLVWFRMTDNQKEYCEYVQIHINDLENFIRELRDRDRRR